MRALLQHLATILKAVEQELQSLAAIGVASLELEEAVQDVLTVVQETTVPELLQDHAPVVHQLQPIYRTQHIVVLGLLQVALVDEADRKSKDGQLELADWAGNDPEDGAHGCKEVLLLGFLLPGLLPFEPCVHRADDPINVSGHQLC